MWPKLYYSWKNFYWFLSTKLYLLEAISSKIAVKKPGKMSRCYESQIFSDFFVFVVVREHIVYQNL